MEFAVGFACFVVGGVAVAGAVRRDDLSRATLWAGAAMQLAVIATLAFDWGYSWVERSALGLIVEQNAWLSLPHVLALTCLVGLARWGSRFAPWASLLSALEAVVFVPVLLSVERNTSMSFLAPAPILALFAAVTGSFLFLPMACRVVPDPGSHWHRVAFGPRSRLIDALAGLVEIGLVVTAPASVLESGGASGRVGSAAVDVSTVPALFPPAYRLRVRVLPAGGVEAGAPLPPRPGFAPRETVRRSGRGLEYEGSSPASFDVGPEGLRAFVKNLAGGGLPGDAS